jgi:hypothetical protein
MRAATVENAYTDYEQIQPLRIIHSCRVLQVIHSENNCSPCNCFAIRLFGCGQLEKLKIHAYETVSKRDNAGADLGSNALNTNKQVYYANYTHESARRWLLRVQTLLQCCTQRISIFLAFMNRPCLHGDGTTDMYKAKTCD